MLTGLFSANKILKNVNIISIVNRFSFFRENMDSLLKTTSLNNFAVLIPIILIILLIALLSISVFKRNRIILIFFLVLIFFDLRFFGNYVEPSSDASYVYKEINDYSHLSFLMNEEEPYRFYPVVNMGILYPNKNLHHNIELVSGYDPLMLSDYNHLTGMVQMDRKEHAERLMKNNNIISMLNNKYIIYFAPEDFDTFKEKIEKIFYEKVKDILTTQNLENLESDGFISLADNHFKTEKNNNSLNYIKIPALIQNNKSYLISFEIKANISPENSSSIEDSITIDIFDKHKGDSLQEFSLVIHEFSGDFKKIYYVVLLNDVSDEKNILFRVLSNHNNDFEIRNISIDEAILHTYNDYQLVNNNEPFSNKDIIILKNNDYMPRFYFTENILNVDNFSEARNIIWEEEVIWDDDKFNFKKQTLVEGLDFEKKGFNISNAKIELIAYSNNEVVLKAENDFDGFLVFSDKYYPGWRAYIDGKEINIYKTNAIVKGVFIPKGSHIIRFNFLPSYFWLLLAISLSTLGGSIFFIFYSYAKEKRNKN
jgi:uncharacterized membrane protein YfhO